MVRAGEGNRRPDRRRSQRLRNRVRPTNVDLHAIAVAADLGDAGEALDIAAHVDASGLSPERQFRMCIDVARAHAQRRHTGDALQALLKAEEHAPEQMYTRPGTAAHPRSAGTSRTTSARRTGQPSQTLHFPESVHERSSRRRPGFLYEADWRVVSQAMPDRSCQVMMVGVRPRKRWRCYDRCTSGALAR